MTNADRRQKRGGRQTRGEWMDAVLAAYRGPGQGEGARAALDRLLVAGRLSVASSPRSAVKELGQALTGH